jgi:cytochrome c oxidase subunit 2
MPVEVVAQQWNWSYRLPGADGVLGRADNRLIGFDNPVGIDPDDPAGQDDLIIEAADLYFELDQPVHILLRSIDVLHNFYVPEFRGKMDMVPGMITFFWFTPTREGNFQVLCAELCGTGHGFMRGGVVVAGTEAYQAWLAEQMTFADFAAARQAERPTQVGALALPAE